jgi:prepilin-type N-terminal cleavage/methylation domain-containing protein/prepilin-type processing-associated H-X9-DG protein
MRKAFTLVETLVVLAIIGLLLALMLSAVQLIRAAAAKTTCLSHCREIGLANQNFLSQRGSFPIGYTYNDKKNIPFQYVSWLTYILPFIEQENLYRIVEEESRTMPGRFDWAQKHSAHSTHVPLYVCPSDSRIQKPRYPEKRKFLAAFTSYVGVCGKSCHDEDGILYANSKVNPNMITDGMHYTLLFGERPPTAGLLIGWWYRGIGMDQQGLGESVLGVTERNIENTIFNCPFGPYRFERADPELRCSGFQFFSTHNGGGHFAFADGAARFISYTAADILPALATIAGGERDKLD